MISASALQQVMRYRSEFTSARPFSHVVIDDFFESNKAEQLLADFPPFDPVNAMNEFGEVGRKATVPDIRKISPFYAEVYSYIASRGFLDFVSHVTAIPDLVHDELMFGGGTHENLEGQELDPHVDFNFLEERKLHRRLNLLLYLNKEWEKCWGGCLELHSNPRRPRENRIKVIEPVFNRCVIFETSERSWHGFERIRLPEDKKHVSRKLLSIYLYTRDRPAEEIVSPHGTFYVQRPMPAHLAAGHTLTEEDVRQIEELLTRRDGWLEHYQKKEIADSRRLQDLTSYVESLKGVVRHLESVERALRVPLTGYALQEGPAQGFWPDGWIGNAFEVAIRLQKPMEAIVVQAYLPEESQPDQELSIWLNGVVTSRHRVQPGVFTLETRARMNSGELVKLGITSDRPYSPVRAGTSPDVRDLVVVLGEIRVLHTAKPKILRVLETIFSPLRRRERRA